MNRTEEMMKTPCVNRMNTCRVFFSIFSSFFHIYVSNCKVFMGKLICFEHVETYFSYWNKTRTTAAKVTYPEDLCIYLNVLNLLFCESLFWIRKSEQSNQEKMLIFLKDLLKKWKKKYIYQKFNTWNTPKIRIFLDINPCLV